MLRFKDKVVIVTGSSQGIGKELVLSFAREGARVVINYNSSKSLAEEVKSEIKNLGNDCLCIRADVSNIKHTESLFNKVLEKWGVVDILVNNASVYSDSTIWNMSEDTWSEVIAADLTSVFNCTKFASKAMRKQESGRIINISSVVGQVGAFGASNYAAAKSGVFGFTKSVSKELASKKITVNAVALGFVETGMLLRLPKQIQDNILDSIPLKRWAKVSEVSSLVKFLSSDEAAYITGQIINLNGGYYL